VIVPGTIVGLGLAPCRFDLGGSFPERRRGMSRSATTNGQNQADRQQRVYDNLHGSINPARTVLLRHFPRFIPVNNNNCVGVLKREKTRKSAAAFILDHADRKTALVSLYGGLTFGTLFCALAPTYSLSGRGPRDGRSFWRCDRGSYPGRGGRCHSGRTPWGGD